MYTREDVELLLPAVCWTHHLHPEQDEYGRTHTCNRNESLWTSPPRKKPKASIDTEQYRVFDWPTPDEIDLMDERSAERWERRIKAACDPDKRKSFSNPKHSNTVWTELIDMQIAWDKASLTEKERAALFLRFEMRWTEEQIGFNQGVSQQTISERIANAVDKIVHRLNNGVWSELVGVEA